jgi:hypothetical protein
MKTVNLLITHRIIHIAQIIQTTLVTQAIIKMDEATIVNRIVMEIQTVKMIVRVRRSIPLIAIRASSLRMVATLSVQWV